MVGGVNIVMIRVAMLHFMLAFAKPLINGQLTERPNYKIYISLRLSIQIEY
jgi:hypothetical protein